METIQTTQINTPMPSPAFALTSDAASRINFLNALEGSKQRFRVTVKGGGCSGFQYEFGLDGSTPAKTDIVVERDGAEAVIDDISLGLLSGAVLDYSEDLSQAGFSIKNPNATASCGCGNSFSVAL